MNRFSLGRKAIYEFWRDLIKSGAGKLVYQEFEIEVVDKSTAILSGKWSMNICHGYITKEKWLKQNNNQWLLAEDDFTVVEQ